MPDYHVVAWLRRVWVCYLWRLLLLRLSLFGSNRGVVRMTNPSGASAPPSSTSRDGWSSPMIIFAQQHNPFVVKLRTVNFPLFATSSRSCRSILMMIFAQQHNPFVLKLRIVNFPLIATLNEEEHKDDDDDDDFKDVVYFSFDS